mgnify:CR=1 FL=1
MIQMEDSKLGQFPQSIGEQSERKVRNIAPLLQLQRGQVGSFLAEGLHGAFIEITAPACKGFKFWAFREERFP